MATDEEKKKQQEQTKKVEKALKAEREDLDKIRDKIRKKGS